MTATTTNQQPTHKKVHAINNSVWHSDRQSWLRRQKMAPAVQAICATLLSTSFHPLLYLTVRQLRKSLKNHLPVGKHTLQQNSIQIWDYKSVTYHFDGTGRKFSHNGCRQTDDVISPRVRLCEGCNACEGNNKNFIEQHLLERSQNTRLLKDWFTFACSNETTSILICQVKFRRITNNPKSALHCLKVEVWCDGSEASSR